MLTRTRRLRILALSALTVFAMATAAACAPAKKGPPSPLVLLVGDSFADNLSGHLALESAARGRPLESADVPGCGVVRGVPTDDGGAPVTGAEACNASIGGLHQERIDTLRPEVVLWLSVHEILGRRVDGGWYFPGPWGPDVAINGAQGDAKILELIEEKRAQLTARGAKLVFITAPPTVEPQAFFAERIAHINGLLRQHVLANPDTTALVDLAAMACPQPGLPCPAFVDGIRLRGPDGAHFSSDGAAWAARQVIARL